MTSGLPTINTYSSPTNTTNKLRISDVDQLNSMSSLPLGSSNVSAKIVINVQQQQPEPTVAPVEKAYFNKPSPQFIIKRVNTQDLHDDHPIRQSNLIGLSAINEENTGDIDEVMLQPRSIDLGDPYYSPGKNNDDNLNMFKTEMINSTKYKEFQKGPIVRDGQIIKHSICGSVETFEKYIRVNKKFSKENNNANFPVGTVASVVINPSERGSFSDISNVGKYKHQSSQSPRQQINKGSSQGEQPSISSSDRPSTQGSSIVGKRFATVAEKKRAMRTDLNLNQDQVIAEIKQIQNRQKQEERQESNKHRGLTLNDKNLLTKEERVLQKHNNVAGQWQKTVDTLNSRVGRDGAKSVMLASDDYRQKKEMAEILDIIKTDEERYGSKYWYKTLRKVELKNATTNFNSIGAVPASLRAQTAGSIGLGSLNRPLTAKTLQGNDTAGRIKTDDERPVSMVEYIRKPRLIQTPAEATRKVEQFPGRTEREYVNSKMSSRKQALKEIRPMEVEGLSELIVQGRNKLELESGAMIKILKSKDSVSVPKNFYSRHTPAQPEEIFEKKMDKVTIMKGGLGTVMF